MNNQVEVYKTLGGGLKSNTADVIQQQPSTAEQKAAASAP